MTIFAALIWGKTKPIQSQTKPILKRAQMNVNLTLTKDYRKKDDFAVQKNKANSNPISERPKMSANVYSTKDYENQGRFRPAGKQTQFKANLKGEKMLRSLSREFWREKTGKDGH